MRAISEPLSLVIHLFTCSFKLTVLSDNLISTIADRLLEDWVSVLIQLGLEYRHVTSIEKKYPNDLYRQALAGLMQWMKTVERTDVGMTDAANKLLTAFDNKERQDIIDVVEKFRGKY